MPLSLQAFPTVAEATATLRSGGARYLGGGTLVVRAANEGDLSLGTFIRSTDASLRRIELAGSNVTLGASVTMAEIARHKDLAPIALAARCIGGPAIRNMATVGGNLFAPAPYGDFAVALLALGASVKLDGKTMDIDQFLIVRDKLDGIVTAVRFGLPAADVFRFLKISRVRPKGVSVLSIAARIETGSDGTVASARIALGCMADRPRRAKAAEEALIGAKLTEEGVAPAVAAVSQGIDPITDAIASAWYRREVLPVHFRRLLLS
jgi:CO/xanthine dehydrogenase FAD-binding subunit